MSNRYFIVNKPYNMVSQFVSPDNVRLLSDLDFAFPKATHAIGRLDRTSEGLLILTTDKKITRLMYSGTPHLRRYLVMIRNEISNETLELLKNGIPIPVDDGAPYIAKPVSVEIVRKASDICPFATDPREVYPHTWLLITLNEGKFRQVRKMVMAAKHRCLRLIRVSIGDLWLETLKPGEVKEIDQEFLFEKVGL